MFHYFPLVLHFHYRHIEFQNGDNSIVSICKEGSTQPALYVLIINSHHIKHKMLHKFQKCSMGLFSILFEKHHRGKRVCSSRLQEKKDTGKMI